jgi:hypothetical protein
MLLPVLPGLIVVLMLLPIVCLLAAVVISSRRSSTAEGRRTERAPAVVKRVRRLTWVGADSHWYSISFEVTPDGQPAFESQVKVTLSKHAAPQPGARMEVAYDPRHHNNLAFMNLPRKHDQSTIADRS